MRPLVLAGVLAGCGFEHGALRGDALVGADVAGDTRGDTASADSTPSQPWSTPVRVLVPTLDDDPTATADLLELYFNRGGDIHVMMRASATADWGDPAEVVELSTGSTETTPEITGDGLTMFLASNRAGSMAGTNDLWMTKRESRNDSWSTPVHVDELSTSADDNAFAPTDDALAVVFNSGTPEQLYASTRATPASLWNARTALTSLDTNARELGPMLSQDRLAIYFGSNRDGDEDLYVATRANVTDAFDPPSPITELNTPGIDADPWVSPDGRHMFFASNRDGALAIYETSR